MNIKEIRISGYKSVADISLKELSPYSVFAGPNGSGKSNFVDALMFVGAVIESGANAAIRRFNGFDQIHCYKFKKDKARRFEFFLSADMQDEPIEYSLKIHNMDSKPQIEEHLKINGEVFLRRAKGEPPLFRKDGNLTQLYGDLFYQPRRKTSCLLVTERSRSIEGGEDVKALRLVMPLNTQTALVLLNLRMA